MASIRARKRRDGTPQYAVLWRDETKTQRSQTFQDLDTAKRFKLNLELDGEDVAQERLDADNIAANKSDTPAVTLDDWMERYIASRTGVHEGTRQDYTRSYNRYWRDKPVAGVPGITRFGALPLTIISTQRHLVAAAQNKLTEKYAAKTIANARGLLSAALDDAVLENLIDRNPCRGMKLPRTGEHEKDEMVFLSPADWTKLHNSIDEHYRPLLRFLVGTGCRWGEATSVQVGDINTTTGDVRIVRSWKRVPGELVLGPPKTKKSRRTVRMPKEVIADIKPLLKGRKNAEFVFTTPAGGTIHIAPFWRKFWRPALKKAGLDPAPRLHDLRHTHASWLISAGIPLTVVQRRLGHESITTTSDTYGHLMPDVIDAAAAAAGAAFSRIESDAKELPAAEAEQAEETGEVIEATVDDAVIDAEEVDDQD